MNEVKDGGKRGFFRFIWDAVNFSRRLVVNLIFVLVVVLIGAALLSEQESVEVPSSSALLFNPVGRVVEQLSYQDPAEQYLNEQFGNGNRANPEVLLSDIKRVFKKAAQDDHIKMMVLDLKGFAGGGLNKLQAIGKAMDEFKAGGKKIVAIGDYYTQNQYYLASHADEINLNPMGGLVIEGYGIHHLYYKQVLAKLKVTRHIFKVGKFKSAVEPYDRQDMSEEAKLANKAWLGALWQQYKIDVAKQRNMAVDNFDETLDAYLDKLHKTDGDMAQYALENGWIDGIKTRQEVSRELRGLVGGSASKGYNHVDYYDYLSLVKSPVVIDNPLSDKVAVVVARGEIIDGNHKAGIVGGESTARLLRRARLDNSVKAVVLRVDSPGGSAFASEIIRSEIDALQAAGKPVVASMSSVAASGGYWISASADEIWASPTTITGSIGIYGMFLTFENSLNAIGVTGDGVATTEMADVSIAQPLNPKLGEVIQLNIERGYRRFIDLVAKSRHMTPEQVDEIAQGRVWIGTKAKELGLVDHLGTYEQAIGAAARLAEIDNYEVKIFEQELSTKDQFYKSLFGVSANASTDGDTQRAVKGVSVEQLVQGFKHKLDVLTRFNDPQYMYAHCEVCEQL